MKKLILSAAAAAMISGAGLALGAPSIPTELLGEPVKDGRAVDRTVTLDPDAHWVTVTQGEAVKFVINGKEFGWVFDGQPSSFDLAQVAPAGTFDHDVRVIVQPYEDAGD